MSESSRQLFWVVSKKDLPAKYQQLDYIDGAGNSANYVETGIYPTFTQKFELETFAWNTDFNNIIIAGALDTSPSMVWFFLAQTFNRKLDLNYGSGGADDIGQTCFVDSKIMHIKSLLENGNQLGWCSQLGDDLQLVTQSSFTADPAYTFTSTIHLLNRTNINCAAPKQLGRTKLWIDGKLEHDYVPCLDLETTQVKMFDIIAQRETELVGTFTGGNWQT